MKKGDEVYIKSEGEGAKRRKDVKYDCKPNGEFSLVVGVFSRNKEEVHFLKPNERLVSELPEIARMTGCYVAVDHDEDVVLSESKMKVDEGLWFPTGKSEAIVGSLTCPNAERFDRQWGPDGELV